MVVQLDLPSNLQHLTHENTYYFDWTEDEEPIQNERGFLLTDTTFQADLVPLRPFPNPRTDGTKFNANYLRWEYLTQTRGILARWATTTLLQTLADMVDCLKGQR